MARHTPRLALMVGLLIASTVAIGGAASAYWTGAGAGAGSAGSGTAGPVTLTPGIPVGELYPGGLADVILTVSNPNTASVRVGSFILDTTRGSGGFAVDAGHAGCGASAFDFTTQTNAGAGWTVPPSDGTRDGSVSISLTDSLSLAVDAANACQGATTTVYLRAGP